MVGLVVVNSVRRQAASGAMAESARPRCPVVTPGSLERVDPLPGGARFAFRCASSRSGTWRATWSAQLGPGPDPVPYGLAEGRVGTGAPASFRRSSCSTVTFGAGVLSATSGCSGRERRRDRGDVARRDGAAPSGATDAAVAGVGSTTSPCGPVSRFRGLGEQSSRASTCAAGAIRCGTATPEAGGDRAGPLYMSIPVVIARTTKATRSPSTRIRPSGFTFGDAHTSRNRQERHRWPSPGDGFARTWSPATSPTCRSLQRADRPTRPASALGPRLPPEPVGLSQTRRIASGVLDGFAREGLPLSVVHLDIDYMDGYPGLHGRPVALPRALRARGRRRAPCHARSSRSSTRA